MKCICENEMKSIIDNIINGFLIGTYFYCHQCGRIFYEDIDFDYSKWIEPKYLENKEDVCSCGKEINTKENCDQLLEFCERCGLRNRKIFKEC